MTSTIGYTYKIDIFKINIPYGPYLILITINLYCYFLRCPLYVPEFNPLAPASGGVIMWGPEGEEIAPHIKYLPPCCPPYEISKTYIFYNND